MPQRSLLFEMMKEATQRSLEREQFSFLLLCVWSAGNLEVVHYQTCVEEMENFTFHFREKKKKSDHFLSNLLNFHISSQP